MQEEKPKVFGKKYNFEITIDPTTNSGLKGLPKHVEDRILTAFKKDEIIADPERVLQCIIEAKVISYGGQVEDKSEEQGVQSN